MKKSKKVLACIIAVLTLGSLTILPVSANNDSLENENVATIGESDWGYNLEVDFDYFKEVWSNLNQNLKSNSNEVIDVQPVSKPNDYRLCFFRIVAKTETGKQIAEDYCNEMGYEYVEISVDPDLIIDDSIVYVIAYNGDNTITIGESSEPSEETLKRGDINGDGNINVLDLLQLKKYILKIIDTLD